MAEGVTFNGRGYTLDETDSGLVVPHTNLPENLQLYKPEDVIQTAKTQVLKPNGYSDRVVLPSIEEITTIVRTAERQNLPNTHASFNATELATFAYNPAQFISRKVLKRAKSADSDVALIGEFFEKALGREASTKYTKEDFSGKNLTRRKKSETTYFDKYEGKQMTRIVSSPSPYEEFVNTAVQIILEHPEVHPESAEVIRSLRELLRQIKRVELLDAFDEIKKAKSNLTNTKWKQLRTHKLTEVFQPVEAPELAQTLLELLKKSNLKQLNIEITQLLELIDIPDLLRESLVWELDKKDLTGSCLAFEITADLSEEKNSNWIQEQTRRKQELLRELEEDPQTIFDNYNSLKQKAKKLVCANPEGPSVNGRIGLEVEYSGDLLFTGISRSEDPPTVEFWDLDYDRGYFWQQKVGEVRRGDRQESLTYDIKYVKSLRILRNILFLAGDNVRSLHVNLAYMDFLPPETVYDINRNLSSEFPIENFIPPVYRSLSDPFEETQTQKLHFDGRLELRAQAVPRWESNLGIQYLDDLVHLYASSYRETDRFEPQPENISLENLERISEETLMWGTICKHSLSAETRLAGLCALRDEKMLPLALNPIKLFNTYQRKDIARRVDEITSIYEERGYYGSKNALFLRNFAENGIPGLLEMLSTSNVEKERFPVYLEGSMGSFISSSLEQLYPDVFSDELLIDTATSNLRLPLTKIPSLGVMFFVRYENLVHPMISSKRGIKNGENLNNIINTLAHLSRFGKEAENELSRYSAYIDADTLNRTQKLIEKDLNELIPLRVQLRMQNETGYSV